MKMIPLTQEKEAIVDDEDFEWLNQWEWYYNNGYATSSQVGLMHRLIMCTPSDMHTDHRDQNKLNNQRYNLRVCTSAENRRNEGKRSDNTSGFKGVSWRKDVSKWQASIRVDGKLIYLRVFPTIELAARAYDEAAKNYFGEFARLNFPEPTSD